MGAVVDSGYSSVKVPRSWTPIALGAGLAAVALAVLALSALVVASAPVFIDFLATFGFGMAACSGALSLVSLAAMVLALVRREGARALLALALAALIVVIGYVGPAIIIWSAGLWI